MNIITIYAGEDACPKCLGWKRVADDDEQTPWKFWAELPPPSNLAVVAGLVKPIECPACHGTGQRMEPSATAICRMCHERIVYVGPYWQHAGALQPRHPALPYETCVSCEKPFSPNLDPEICDACINEAMQHKPTLYAQIRLVGYGSYVQPLDQFATAMQGEFDGAEAGTKWEIELIEMTPAEYAELPEFTGH